MSRLPFPAAGERGGPDSFRALMDRAPVAFAVARDGVIRYVNPAFTRIHGVSAPHTAVGERLGERIAPGARALFLERAQRQPSNPVVDDRFETMGLRADGTTFAMLATVANIHVADGQVTTGFFEDISEQRNAEDDLKQAARFRAAVDSSHDAVLFADADAVILYRSPVCADIYGYADEHRIGRSGWETIHPDDLPAVRRAWAQMLAAPERTVAVESRIRHADGHWLRADSKLTNLLHDPDVGAVVVNTHDVTERRRLEEERLLLEKQLLQAQRLDAVGRLAGGVAHDFNNMLSVILVSTDLALAMLDTAHPVVSDLIEIQKAAERSAALTSQLLAFARQQPAERTVLNLDDAVEATLSMLRRLIGENITLLWRPGSGLSRIVTDPSQLEQVLTNLSVNARDAIAGVGTLTIETRVVEFQKGYFTARVGVPPGRYITLVMSDTGWGIDPESMPHVFEPFFTTKTSLGGTGLGLATVYGIMKQNGGGIDVTSRVGEGTTFTLYFPASDRVPSNGPNGPLAGPSLAGHETILVVEDEPVILKLTERVLSGWGYTVLCAHTPSDAIELVRAQGERIDLLLTDVIMPEMNGRDLARRLKAMKPDLKCVYMSGYTADLIGVHCVLDDDVDFIEKPWTNAGLGEMLRTVLERR